MDLHVVRRRSGLSRGQMPRQSTHTEDSLYSPVFLSGLKVHASSGFIGVILKGDTSRSEAIRSVNHLSPDLSRTSDFLLRNITVQQDQRWKMVTSIWLILLCVGGMLGNQSYH